MLATAALTMATGLAFTQDPSTTPNQHDGVGNSATQHSGASMNDNMQAPAKRATIGSAVESPAAQSQEKAKNPASTDAGIEQEK
jgi:hypothetical protein